MRKIMRTDLGKHVFEEFEWQNPKLSNKSDQ